MMFGAAGVLVLAAIVRLAADTYGERRSTTVLLFGLSLLCAAIGLREIAL